MADIQRRKSVTGSIGGVRIGSDAPVVVQSMTNTDTADIPSTVQQVAALARAGSELVRVTVNNEEAAAAVAPIVEQLDKQGVQVPIIGDFHYNGHILLKKYPECARALAKYRINPGNVGIGRKDDNNFRTMIEVAVENQKPVRIGVNWGSLDQALLTRMMDENSLLPEPKDAREVTMEAMVVSALNSASPGGKIRIAERSDHPQRQGQRVQDLIDVSRSLAAGCNYPLHLGLTEPARAPKASSLRAPPWGLSQEGMGDTIRVSLTPAPGGDRTEESTWDSRSCNPWASAASPPSDCVSGMRWHDQHVFPGNGAADPILPSDQMPVWEGTLHGGRRDESCGHGLRSQRPRRIETRQPRHLVARNLRGTESAGLRRRPPLHHPQGRQYVAEFIQILDDYVESHYAAKEELAANNVGASVLARAAAPESHPPGISRFETRS